jgi:hypothetical protein
MSSRLARIRDQHAVLGGNSLGGMAALRRAFCAAPPMAHQAWPVRGVCVSDWRERCLHRVRQAFDKAQSTNAESRNDDVKRRAFKLVMLLMLGAIVNVAVAWGFAALHEVHDEADFTEDYFDPADGSNDPGAPGAWFLWAFEQDGCSYFATAWLTEPIRDYMRPVGIPVDAIPFWAADLVPTIDDRKTSQGTCVAMAFGWPAHSVRCLYRHDQVMMPPPSSLTGGVRLPRMVVPPDREAALPHLTGIHRALPLKPLWPGFVANTLFYTGILCGGWLLFAAPFALRRRRRVKRGLCPTCAYPVGDSAVCTECGTAVVKQKAQRQKAEIT